jgi:hypothetical protein
MTNTDPSVTASTTARQPDAHARPGGSTPPPRPDAPASTHDARPGAPPAEHPRLLRRRPEGVADVHRRVRPAAARRPPRHPRAVRRVVLAPARPAPRSRTTVRPAYHPVDHRPPPVRRHRPPPVQAAAGRRRRGGDPRPAEGEGEADGAERRAARPGPGPALLVRHMERIAAVLPPRHPRPVADDAALRPRGPRARTGRPLRTRDIVEDPEGRGLVVDVRVSKIAPRTVEVPYGSRAHLCPVRAWRRWKETAGLTADPDNYAYRRPHNRWHTVLDQGLDVESIGDVLTRLGACAGLEIRTRRSRSRPCPGPTPSQAAASTRSRTSAPCQESAASSTDPLRRSTASSRRVTRSGTGPGEPTCPGFVTEHHVASPGLIVGSRPSPGHSGHPASAQASCLPTSTRTATRSRGPYARGAPDVESTVRISL